MVYEIECPCCEYKIRNSSTFISGGWVRCDNCGDPNVAPPPLTNIEKEIRDQVTMQQFDLLNRYLEVYGAEEGPLYVYRSVREEENDRLVGLGIWQRCEDPRLADNHYALTPLGLRILHELNKGRRP